MHILIIEDEKKTAAFLQRGLLEQGFAVDVCHDGAEGLNLAISIEYDLIILDIMLPVMDGLTVLSKLRARHQSTPVLLLSARDTLDDRVRGLEIGADDYLVKPFAFIEVLARVRTILRRGNTIKPDQLTIADLTIDQIRHKVYRAGQLLDLTPKEFSLLALFMNRPGEVLSRTLISEQVWDVNFDFDSNIIDVAIRRLRQKMDDPFIPRLLHTVRGIGYVLEVRE